MIGDGAVLIGELVQVVNDFDLGWANFRFGVGLVHFGDDLDFLLDLRNGLIAFDTVALRADVLDEEIGTPFTVIRSGLKSVDSVHFCYSNFIINFQSKMLEPYSSLYNTARTINLHLYFLEKYIILYHINYLLNIFTNVIKPLWSS